MPPWIAACLFAVGIAGLFVLDRDHKAKTPKALWIPTIWIWIIASREVSRWLATFGLVDADSLANQTADGNAIDRWIYTGLMLLGVAVLVRRRPALRALAHDNLPILLFFFYCAVSTLWSDYPAIAMKRWVKALGDLVMLLVVFTDADPLAAVKRLLARATFLLIPLSVLFMKYYPEFGKGYKAWSWTPVYFGVATHKNTLGVTCMLFGLASQWRLQAALHSRSRNRYIAAHAVIIVMVFWILWTANSMTALLCFVLAGGLMLATWAELFSGALLHGAIFLVVSFSFYFLFISGTSLEAIGRDPTLTGRTALWDLVLQLSGNPVIGTGFESFWLGSRVEKIWSVYWWHPNEAHNGYLEMFLNLGWIGIALLATLIITGYRNIRRSLRRDRDIGLLKLSYFVVALIYNLTEAGFRMLDPIWFTFLLAVLATPDPSPRQIAHPARSPATICTPASVANDSAYQGSS